jgi:hypothetical protein
VRWLLLALAAAPAVAHADAAVEEIAVGGTPSTDASPGSSWVSDKLAGIWDAGEDLQVRLDVSATRAYTGSTTSISGDVLNAALSVDYTLDTHWTVHAGVGWSPQSETHATESVDTGGEMLADAYLRASSSSMSAGAGIGYETGGDSDRETSASLGVNATYFDSQQEITSIRDATGQMVGVQQMRTACAAQVCSSELQGALWPQWAQLGQFAIDASVSETIDDDTDLGVGAAYYVYDRDPQKLGYFALATVGRGTLGSATGVAPMDFTVTPSVAERWGDLAATATINYGSYLENQGYELGASVRVQYKLKLDDQRRVKLYGKLGSSWHVNPANELGRSGSLALGAQYTW